MKSKNYAPLPKVKKKKKKSKIRIATNFFFQNQKTKKPCPSWTKQVNKMDNSYCKQLQNELDSLAMFESLIA